MACLPLPRAPREQICLTTRHAHATRHRFLTSHRHPPHHRRQHPAPPAGTLQARLTMHALPVYLGLVGTLADRHPALRRKVLRLLERLLRLESEDASDALSMVALKQMLLDCVLMLLCRGCELSALAFLKVGRTRTQTHTLTLTQTLTLTLPLTFLKDYLAVADHAIVRRCVTQLLRVAQPPFSDVFARALLSVLHLPHVISAFRPAAAADGKRAVVERVQALRQAHEPLAREAKKLLEKLK